MNKKEWKLQPEVSDDFIAKFPDLDKLTLQLLFNRSIAKEEEIESFINPDYSRDTFDPFLFNDMEKAVDLIIEHIKKQNKIVIYGDYDVDGVTSSSLLLNTIKSLKGVVSVYIPDRKSEGYGIHKKAIDNIISDGASLMISVDCGIRNKEEVNHAKEKGLDVIITDHHTASENIEDLPKCLIINPKTPGETYPFKQLAGVGVAFKLSQALISRAKVDDEMKDRLIERGMDLLAIGTVADCVELVGENRALLIKGLDILDSTNRPGIKELMNIAKISDDKKIESWNIGFQIAPRLNAAGRMGHAISAYNLLTTEDITEAKKIALELNKRNMERQEITEEIIKYTEKNLDHDDSILISISPEGVAWEEGVVGLVSGRVTEKYYKPSLVITRTKKGYKGSGRSIDELNILDLLKKCEDKIEKYGGHAKACGFSVAEEKIDDFVKCVKEEAKKELSGLELSPKINIEAKIELGDVDVELIDRVVKFAPFGEANPAPFFLSEEVKVMDKMKMGADGQHLKLRLKNGKVKEVNHEVREADLGQGSNMLNALGFWQTEKWKNLDIGDTIDIVYTLENNKFNGRTDPQMRIVDIKKISNE
ncbi:MAG: single-stranded-DNA-specific exonuclease RecJ [Patescibacteria group bacterium]|jgi:single-stranded-DNA-specific exonuclease|nr:single-stranded-DNA-specific exonuclease RecJ [Patescibacteria group bacterium]